MKDKKIQEKEEINLKLQNKKKVQKLKEKGITLIALVVTIIILLILVGVTISQLSGENGLIRRAKEAVERYKNSSEEELIQLGKIEQAELTGSISKNVYILTESTTMTSWTGTTLKYAIPDEIVDTSGWNVAFLLPFSYELPYTGVGIRTVIEMYLHQ